MYVGGLGWGWGEEGEGEESTSVKYLLATSRQYPKIQTSNKHNVDIVGLNLMGSTCQTNVPVACLGG